MQITWMGTNSLLIEADGEKLLFDPFVELQGGTNPNCLEDFEGLETILITHGHFDHLFFVPELLEPELETDEKENDDDEENDEEEDGGEREKPTVFCTRAAADTLEQMCEDTDTVAVVAPGLSFSIGKVKVKVFQGRHIRFDRKLIMKTLLSWRILKYMRNLIFELWAVPRFKENGETVVYELEAEGKRIQVLGSLGLDENESYQPGADLLVMPYQGNSFLEREADRVIRVLQPKRILLSHFDDAFPPVSSEVDLRGLRRLMKQKYPQIPVVKPRCGVGVRL